VEVPDGRSTILAAGLNLRASRERLGLTMRDVENATLRIGERHGNDEFIISPSRLSDLETKRVRSVLTHEEMAQMIGSSHETVTRLLSELKKKELIRLEGSTLVIRNRTALEALAA
jgi:CRP-like cAMP-binding protein